MRLYLVRHGNAVPKDENPDRPLSDKGRRDVERMAAFLRRSGTRVAHVVHSGRTRAAETALLLAEKVGPGQVVHEMTGLAPNDPPFILGDAANGWEEDSMAVGHMPHMGQVAAHLLSHGDAFPAALFETGGVMCLERQDNGATPPAWVLLWHVQPSLLGG